MRDSGNEASSNSILDGLVNLGGLLCLVAAIVLSWPGAEWVRADEPGEEELLMSVQPDASEDDHAGSVSQAGPALETSAAQCTPGQAEAAPMLGVEQAVAAQRVRAQLRAQSQPVEGFVVLNGRGYNYGPGPGGGVAQSQAAIAREMAEQQ